MPVPSTMFSTSAFPLFSQPGTSHNFSLASPSCSLSPMVRSDSSHFDERSMCASSDISERSAEVPRVHSLDSFQRKEWPTESLKSQFFSAIRPPISITHHNRGSPTITTRDDGVLVVKIPPFRPVESPLASPMTQDISRLQSSSQSPRTEPEETESLKQSNENGKTEHSEQWKSLPSLANQAVNRSSSDTSNNLPQIIKENFLDVIEETDLTVGEIEKGKRTDSHVGSLQY